jgi:acyl-CoA thioester hydrolase
MSAETPTSGWADSAAREHVFPVRVYFEDTDAGGIVYHANYLKFAERARTEMLRLLGHDQFDLLAQLDIGFTVRRCEVDYLAPARLDDALEVRTRLLDVRGASLRLAQTVSRGGTALAQLTLRIACMHRSGRAVRMPDPIRSALEALAKPA